MKLRIENREEAAHRHDEERLQNEPDNLKLLRSLAELYTQKNKFDQALELYQRIKNSDLGGDSTLDLAIVNTQVRRFDFQLTQLDATAPDHAEQLAKLTAEKLAFQMAECQKRVEKYPTDLAIRFEMANLYLAAGKINEAIIEYQKAQGNPHKRIAAMSGLAQCFARRKMFDSAVRTLQNAIKEKVAFDDEKKDLIYQIGCVFEGMGKKAEANEQFVQIWETDAGYRDVAAKVDAFYAGQ